MPQNEMKILITGGAGFIGTHLTRRLLREGCSVRILDSFSPQIHGNSQTLPSDIAPHVELVAGDVRDRDAIRSALEGAEVVVHLAAETGTGQSMYEVVQYEQVNLLGTAHLMDYVVNNKSSRVQKLVTASSRAIYGEGKYHCPAHGTVYPGMRSASDMVSGQFEPICPNCSAPCEMLATDELSRLSPTSFYGITKQVQEQMTLIFGQALNLSAFALRYQNVYGPGQSLKNPYTGILAIFSNLARVNQSINIFEDGKESRDFVYIDDVVESSWRCIRTDTQGVEAINVGSGERTTVLQVVHEIIQYFESHSEISVSGAFRIGDIRHNVADLTKARQLLDFTPKWKFTDGISRFLNWASQQESNASTYEKSLSDMRERGLMRG